MTLIILGVLLWALVHLMKRLAPDLRAQLGDKKAPGIVTIGIAVSIVLMVIGYRMADFIAVWEPPTVLKYVNNLLVLIAVFLMSPAPAKGVIFNGLRHPMLTGFALWAVAHLLVNGDIASIVLFGGLLIWSLVAMMMINRAEPDWAGREAGSLSKDAMFFVASIVLVLVIGTIHGWLGPSVF